MKQQIIDTAMKGARANYEHHGSLMPIAFLWLGINPDTGEHADNLAIIGAGGDFNDENKAHWINGLKSMLRQFAGKAIVTVVECWTTHGPGALKQRPSESPNREECLMLLAEDRNGVQGWMAMIKDKQLAEWKPMETGELHGQFSQFLPRFN